MTLTDAYNDLRRMLCMRAIRTGQTFKLASGRESDFFIDCKQAVLSARGHRLAGMLLLRKINEQFRNAHAVAGVELGGCPLVSAIATYSAIDPENGGCRELDALYVRKAPKDHGTEELIEGRVSVRLHARVVVVEDVVTTGLSSIKTVNRLTNAGYEVLGVVALVDREEGAAEEFLSRDIPLHSIYTQRTLRDGP